ncbi:hypothetical protein GCM10022247_19730 [Allokutzneria multivorans]|uniref:Uncharacterized protein n=1 Tax=Allokutzneria multivorans TaxID=1142134 RepID=A0ABP7RM18_9PSEU
MTAPQPPSNQNQGGQQAPGENNEDKGGAVAEQPTPSSAGDLPTTTHGAGQEGAQGISSALGGSGDSADATQVVAPSTPQQAVPGAADATQVVGGGSPVQQPQQQPGQPQQPQWGAQQPQQQWGQQPPQPQAGTPSGGFQQPAWGAQQQPGAQPQGQWGQQQHPQGQWGQPQQQWGQQQGGGAPPMLLIAMWASIGIGGLFTILGIVSLINTIEAFSYVSKAQSSLSELSRQFGGRIPTPSAGPGSGTLVFALILAIVILVGSAATAACGWFAGQQGKEWARLGAGVGAGAVALSGLITMIVVAAGATSIFAMLLFAGLAVLWFLPMTVAEVRAKAGMQPAQAGGWGQQQGQWGQQQPQQGQWGQQQPQQGQWGQQAPQQPQQQWGQQQPGQPGQQQGWPGQQ